MPHAPIRLTAAGFARCELHDPAQAGLIRASGSLAGRASFSDDWRQPGWFSISGWVEWDVDLPVDGWWELRAEPDAAGALLAVDDEAPWPAPGGPLLGARPLAAGHHRLRLTRHHWSGLPATAAIELRPAPAGARCALRLAGGSAVLRLGEALRAQVAADPAEAGELALRLVAADGAVAASRVLPAAPGWRQVELVCPLAGVFRLELARAGRALGEPAEVLVCDARPLVADDRALDLEPLADIDCAQQAPGWWGGIEPRVVRRGGLAYREAGPLGYLQHLDSERPGWFAYAATVDPGEPCLLTVDVPDDALRTTLVVVREGGPGPFSYPVSIGADSGGEFRLGGGTVPVGTVFWPSHRDLRLCVLTPQTGRPAAASRIRLWRIRGGLPAQPRTPGGRTWCWWNEEGDNYRAVTGIAGGAPADLLRAADRWAALTARQGGGMLMPTVSIYQMAMYPSAWNRDHVSEATRDHLRILALACERHGLRLVPEFHPELRELGWPLHAAADAVENRLLDRFGRKPTRQNQPHWHPLHPRTREALLGLVGECARRYADSSAFAGLSLRVMGWSDPAMISFGPLTWGYDDLAFLAFCRDTGRDDPGAGLGESRFAARQERAVGAWREAWIAWRCQRITALVAEARDALRAARSDLVLHLHIANNPSEDVREMGIDVALLADLPGVRVVEGRIAWGRRSPTEGTRDHLVQPGALRAAQPVGSGAFIFGQAYFEGTEAVMPATSMGLPKPATNTWISGAVQPAGRHAVERHALALAATDAELLGDGGNGWCGGGDELRGFLAEFTRLPARPFADRSDAVEPVRVRERSDPDGTWAYAVNVEPYPVEVALRWPGAVRRLGTGAELRPVDGVLHLRLAAYELVAMRGPVGSAIISVSCTIPAAESGRTAALVATAAAITATAATWLSEAEAATLRGITAAAQSDLAAGLPRSARSRIECHAMAMGLPRLGVELPGLREDGRPQASAGAVPAAAIRAAADCGELVAASTLDPGWDAELLRAAGVLRCTLVVPVDGRYRLLVAAVQGGAWRPLRLRVAGEEVGVLALPGEPPRGLLLSADRPLRLRAGTVAVELSAEGGLAIAHVVLEPIFTDLAPARWRALGPFAPDTAPEPPLRLDPAVLPWRPVPGAGPFIDLGAANGGSSGSISYAVTTLRRDRAGLVRLRFSADYWIALWIDGRQVQETISPSGAPVPGQFSLDAELPAGDCQLLAKVAGGGLGNGFWLAISDPG